MDKPIGSTDPDAVIHGIPRIAEFIGATERRTQWLHESRKIPTFKLGKLVCLRIGTWRNHVAKLEQAAENAQAPLRP